MNRNDFINELEKIYNFRLNFYLDFSWLSQCKGNAKLKFELLLDTIHLKRCVVIHNIALYNRKNKK